MHILEIFQRAQKGPKISKESFNLDRIYLTAKTLCEQHQIVFDGTNPVIHDDAVADRLYQAALHFLVETGIFCSDTGRLIRFSLDEVHQAIEDSPGESIMGEGSDRRSFRSRRPESTDMPWFHVGSSIFNSTEELSRSVIYGYASIPRTNSVSVPAVKKVSGVDIQPGTPIEVLGAIHNVTLAREAIEKAGRPGLPIANCLGTAGTALPLIAASSSSFGLRPSDAWLVSSRSEMKTDFDLLNKTAFLQKLNGNICSTALPFVGGYAGGPAETALVAVAYILMGKLIYNANHHLLGILDLMTTCGGTRGALWAMSAAIQAISRNTKEPFICLSYNAAGPMTRQYFYEAATHIITAVVSGSSVQTPHPAKGLHEDRITPMEGLATIEIATACVKNGLKREDANELVRELLTRYEGNLTSVLPGARYQECFNVDTAEPLPAYLDLYGSIKEEFSELGLPIDSVPGMGNDSLS